MKVKQLKSRLKESENLFKTALQELKFKNMKVAHLENVLEEVVTMTDDKLAKSIIYNRLERHRLDTLVHARNIFNK